MEPKCENCKFWHDCRPNGGTAGQCRRHGPVVCGTSETGYSQWPVVEAYEWCGEFQPKDDHDALQKCKILALANGIIAEIEPKEEPRPADKGMRRHPIAEPTSEAYHRELTMPLRQGKPGIDKTNEPRPTRPLGADGA